jgi:exopolyphosphatase/guanosine-5'-triphosphate,3'-diphosphate pyrophosphatase
MRFFRDGRIDRSSLKKAQVAAAAEFEEAIALFSRANWSEAFGSSGTIGAVSEVLRAEGWTDGTITPDALQRVRAAVLEAGEIGRIKLAGMKPDRQSVMPGGLSVLAAVFETLGITEMRPARGGLRVGVLYDLLGRREQKDVRHATVERVMNRFAVDRDQAGRVRELALALHEALEPHAPEEAKNRLHWAALLHEVGFAISHSDYHKHSAYLVQNADLAGFSTTDQERIATLVLAQRGNLKKVADALSDRERAAKILALRLAVILAHARRPVRLPHLSLWFGNSIEFSIDGDWLADHPLTQHLLEEEAGLWERAGVGFSLRTS